MLGIMGVCVFSEAPDINAHIRDIRLQAVYHFFQITLEVIAKLFGFIHFSAVDIRLILHQRIIAVRTVKEYFNAVAALFVKRGQTVKHEIVCCQSV